MKAEKDSSSITVIVEKVEQSPVKESAGKEVDLDDCVVSVHSAKDLTSLRLSKITSDINEHVQF